MRRIGLLICLLALVGCGGGARHVTKHIPHDLASSWAQRADAVSAAAASGDSCHAKALAGALESDVIDNSGRVPLRYRGALLDAVNRLARSLVCNPTTVVRTVPGPPKPKPKPKPKPPHHGHDHGHGHGPGGGQGGDGG